MLLYIIINILFYTPKKLTLLYIIINCFVGLSKLSIYLLGNKTYITIKIIFWKKNKYFKGPREFMDNCIFWRFFVLYRRSSTYIFVICSLGVLPTPPWDKAWSQKSGNVANVRTSRQGAKNLQFLSGCNF